MYTPVSASLYTIGLLVDIHGIIFNVIYETRESNATATRQKSRV